MSIQVKFFASLRERLNLEDTEIDAADATTVTEVWAHVTGGQAIPENTLLAVNMTYVDARHPVRDGDEVAFFPPVTGG